MRESRYRTSRSSTKFFLDWADIFPLRSRRRFCAVWEAFETQTYELGLQRTSGKFIFYFYILLCGHAEKSGNAIAVGIPICEPPPHNGAG
jgi:hypothetical protein